MQHRPDVTDLSADTMGAGPVGGWRSLYASDDSAGVAVAALVCAVDGRRGELKRRRARTPNEKGNTNNVISARAKGIPTM